MATEQEMESVSVCARATDDDRALRYLQDRLPEPEREAFEVHLLECDACSELVEAARVARDVLRQRTPAAKRPIRLLPAASLAAGLAAAAAASFLLLRPAPPEPIPSPPRATVAAPPRTIPPVALEELARADAPTYIPLTMRSGTASDAAFERAMGHYARREYEPAADGLRAVVRGRPSFGEAWFFLGVSELMAGRAQEARDDLAHTVRLGQPPYAEAAAFFQAKAELRLGATAEARAVLRDLVAGGGSYRPQAQRLLDRLDALGR